MIAAMSGSRRGPGRTGLRERAWFMGCAALSLALHLIAFGLLRGPANRPGSPATPRPPVSIIDIEPPQPPPAPLPGPPPATARPSAPRRAAEVLMAAREKEPARPDRPVLDFTAGTAAVFSGGTASADGALAPGPGQSHSLPAVGDGAGIADRSRRAAVAGPLDWGCPFPQEADAAGRDEAVAALSILVSREGAAEAVTVLGDPGAGFGRAARSCALTRRYLPARDRQGNPVASELVVHVRFLR
jgi:periplasmic protein TonB